MATWFVRAIEWYAEQPTCIKVGAIVGGAVVGAVAGVIAAPTIGAAASAAGLGVAGKKGSELFFHRKSEKMGQIRFLVPYPSFPSFGGYMKRGIRYEI